MADLWSEVLGAIPSDLPLTETDDDCWIAAANTLASLKGKTAFRGVPEAWRRKQAAARDNIGHNAFYVAEGCVIGVFFELSRCPSRRYPSGGSDSADGECFRPTST